MDYLTEGLEADDKDVKRIPWDVIVASKTAHLFGHWLSGSDLVICDAPKTHPVWGKFAGRVFRRIRADGGVMIEIVTDGSGNDALPLDHLRQQIQPGEDDLGARIEQHNKEKAELQREVADFKDQIDDIACMLGADLSEEAGRSNMITNEQTNYTDSPRLSQVGKKTAEVDDHLQPKGENTQLKAEEKDYKEDWNEIDEKHGGDWREREPAQNLVQSKLNIIAKLLASNDSFVSKIILGHIKDLTLSPQAKEAAGKGPYPAGTNPPGWVPASLREIWRAAVERYVEEEGGDANSKEAYPAIIQIYKGLMSKYAPESIYKAPFEQAKKPAGDPGYGKPAE